MPASLEWALRVLATIGLFGVGVLVLALFAGHDPRPRGGQMIVSGGRGLDDIPVMSLPPELPPDEPKTIRVEFLPRLPAPPPPPAPVSCCHHCSCHDLEEA